ERPGERGDPGHDHAEDDERDDPPGRAHPLTQLEARDGAHTVPGERPRAARDAGRARTGCSGGCGRRIDLGAHRRSSSRARYADSSAPLAGANVTTGIPAPTTSRSRATAVASPSRSTR